MAARKKGKPVLWLMILFGLTLVAAAVGLGMRQETQKQVALAQAMDLPGPPCKELTAEAFAARGWRGRETNAYSGVKSSRASGQMVCKEIAGDGGRSATVRVPVCQFQNPGGLTVTFKGQTRYFEPGGPATVVGEGDKVRCAVAANLALFQ